MRYGKVEEVGREKVRKREVEVGGSEVGEVRRIKGRDSK